MNRNNGYQLLYEEACEGHFHDHFEDFDTYAEVEHWLSFKGNAAYNF